MYAFEEKVSTAKEFEVNVDWTYVLVALIPILVFS